MAESLPPMKVETLLTALDNPHFSSYLYFGGANDKGWKVARGVQKFMPGLRVYRLTGAEAGEVKATLGLSGNPRGVVLDFGRGIVARLNKAQTENALKVMEEVKNA